MLEVVDNRVGYGRLIIIIALSSVGVESTVDASPIKPVILYTIPFSLLARLYQISNTCARASTYLSVIFIERRKTPFSCDALRALCCDTYLRKRIYQITKANFSCLAYTRCWSVSPFDLMWLHVIPYIASYGCQPAS